MKVKLDENIDPRAKEILKRHGHEAITVTDEGLQGASDETVALTVMRENMCLLTLDLGFSNVLRYPPEKFAGIVVLRHPKPTVQSLLELVNQFATLLKNNNPAGQLWIVEPARLRVWEPRKTG